jgi:hypothetical protein
MATRRGENPKARRYRAYSEMLPPTQKVAKIVEDKLRKINRGCLLIAHDIGALMDKVIKNEGVYGTSAEKEIARFTGLRGGHYRLYDLRKVAVAFSREALEEEAVTPMANGAYLDLDYFVEVSELPSPAARQELLDRIRSECLSLVAVRRETRPKPRRSRTIRSPRVELEVGEEP